MKRFTVAPRLKQITRFAERAFYSGLFSAAIFLHPSLPQANARPATGTQLANLFGFKPSPLRERQRSSETKDALTDTKRLRRDYQLLRHAVSVCRAAPDQCNDKMRNLVTVIDFGKSITDPVFQIELVQGYGNSHVVYDDQESANMDKRAEPQHNIIRTIFTGKGVCREQAAVKVVMFWLMNPALEAYWVGGRTGYPGKTDWKFEDGHAMAIVRLADGTQWVLNNQQMIPHLNKINNQPELWTNIDYASAIFSDAPRVIPNLDLKFPAGKKADHFYPIYLIGRHATQQFAGVKYGSALPAIPEISKPSREPLIISFAKNGNYRSSSDKTNALLTQTLSFHYKINMIADKPATIPNRPTNKAIGALSPVATR